MAVVHCSLCYGPLRSDYQTDVAQMFSFGKPGAEDRERPVTFTLPSFLPLFRRVAIIEPGWLAGRLNPSSWSPTLFRYNALAARPRSRPAGLLSDDEELGCIYRTPVGMPRGIQDPENLIIGYGSFIGASCYTSVRRRNWNTCYIGADKRFRCILDCID